MNDVMPQPELAMFDGKLREVITAQAAENREQIAARYFLGSHEPPTVQQVAWVFAHLHDHLMRPGTFRHLIYDRMGFDPSAYSLLCRAGGRDISDSCFYTSEYLAKVDKGAGEILTDVCPRHEVHEVCHLLNHFHLGGYCYRTFQMECGEVFTSKNLQIHCSK